MPTKLNASTQNVELIKQRVKRAESSSGTKVLSTMSVRATFE
jgi:hypothetical protein